MREDVLATVFAVLIVAFVYWFNYLYTEYRRPITTTEWCARMRKLDLGTKRPTSLS